MYENKDTQIFRNTEQWNIFWLFEEMTSEDLAKHERRP